MNMGSLKNNKHFLNIFIVIFYFILIKFMTVNKRLRKKKKMFSTGKDQYWNSITQSAAMNRCDVGFSVKNILPPRLDR